MDAVVADFKAAFLYFQETERNMKDLSTYVQ
jgi:hypothetical protein